MTRIDHRIAGSEQRHKGRLRPAQLEGNLIVAVGGHLLEVAIPRFAWIETKLLARLADQQVPGAFDVPCGQRPAVVPLRQGVKWHDGRPLTARDVSWVPSSLQDQPVARSETIDCMLFCFT